MNTPKLKKCKTCKELFLPRTTTQRVCSYFCALEDVRRQKEKAQAQERKAWRKEKKKRRDKMKTASDWRKDLEKVFNQYIRLRDQGRQCISCNTVLDPKRAKYDAGHYMSKGHYPELAFIEDNVHGQCVECNRYRGGNYHEYTERLPRRIGQARYEQLIEKKNKPVKLSTPEIKELILHYKDLVKDLTKRYKNEI